jgi:urease accessory protein
MLRLHGILGHSGDPELRGHLHRLAHAGAIELLFVPEADAGRGRLRLATDKGTDCALSLDRDERLVDGAVLLMEEERAIVVRLGAEQRLRLRPSDASAALRLGWHAGNLHWRVRFEGADLVVLPDGPPVEALARLRSLIEDGLVTVVDGA